MWNRSENQISLVLIRHGATQGNQEHRYLGKTDEPLSEEGKREIEAYQKQRCYPKIDNLFTSPLRRCIQTAEILYPDILPVQMEELAEMDFGAFEGKNYRELQNDKGYQVWIDSNGTLPFPEGESREEFLIRCERGFHRIRDTLKQEENKHPVNTVGLIVHGGTIMALLSRFCGGEYFDYQVANGKGYLCTVTDWKENFRITEFKKI